jgi:nucleotide-binding universal stress UspA family protein
LEWWRCEVAVAESIPDCIADFAERENADLVAMHTHRDPYERVVTRDVAARLGNPGSAELRALAPIGLGALSQTNLN